MFGAGSRRVCGRTKRSNGLEPPEVADGKQNKIIGISKRNARTEQGGGSPEERAAPFCFGHEYVWPGPEQRQRLKHSRKN